MMEQWPADQIERRSIDSLIPYARNARTHSEAQVAQIAASIREWGWTIPVLIDEAGRIIAGHGRVLAAHMLGIVEVPAIVARGWTEAQKQAYTLADNKLALNAEWNLDMLRVELADLRDQQIDLQLLGFEVVEVDQLFASDQDLASEWAGMPDYDQTDQMSFRRIIVHFKDQDAVDDFAKLIQQHFTINTKFVWFPALEPVRQADKQYESSVSDLHPV